MLMKLLRKLTVTFLIFSLCLTTVACGSGANQNQPQANNASQTTNISKLKDGQYPVQQATYNDADGEYTLFLLNATPPTVRTENLQMARLTDDDIKQGKKTYLKVENGQPAMYLTEDFKIEYVHNVTQAQTNPQTGQQETVVVRQESSFWTPFAGALAGQALGSLLFRPQYYVPPVYQPGVPLSGYGGYGRSYNDAVSSYQSRYNQPPAAVRNRTVFRTTGNLRRNTSTVRTTPPTATGNRATGSGYGSRNLRQSGKGSGTIRRPPPSRSFGGRTSPRRR
ncbi:hypothetical protein B4U84_04440 [Westiellopsis prolifica IICB1]|nr:hypothetical protein B4U84_04440 [Westiellopsis prolifica IICB1]